MALLAHILYICKCTYVRTFEQESTMQMLTVKRYICDIIYLIYIYIFFLWHVLHIFMKRVPTPVRFPLPFTIEFNSFF